MGHAPRVTQTVVTNDYGHNADYRNIEDCSGIVEATAYHYYFVSLCLNFYLSCLQLKFENDIVKHFYDVSEMMTW